MLTLDCITMREIRLPLREPFRISSGLCTERRILLLELRDADGATAWSECVADDLPNYSPETTDTAWHAITRWLAPRVLGVPFDSPADVHAALERDIRGHRMARAAVEMGMWALAAELGDMPLARLLSRDREPLAEIATGISLGIQRSPAALAERAGAALEQGYRKIKLKIAPGADIEFVGAVRRALGPEAPLMADANSAYAPADAAHLERLDEFGLMMLEQPLAHDDLVRHAALQRRLATPICLDESITSVARAEDMFSLGSGQIVNIKPGRVGGFSESLAIHDLCLARGAPVWCGGMLESGIGRAYNVALAALPGFTIPGDVSPSARYWERDIVAPEWTLDERGMVRVPLDRPGLGVTVDVNSVSRLTVRRETLCAPGAAAGRCPGSGLRGQPVP